MLPEDFSNITHQKEDQISEHIEETFYAHINEYRKRKSRNATEYKPRMYLENMMR